MGDRGTKVALFDGFARVGRALASGRRIELLDVLANGERAAEALAGEVGLSVANTSQHLQVLSRDRIKLRVWERGAGETLACGTGACAAVAAGVRRGLLDGRVRVATRGGDLTIEWRGGDNPVWMTGPAVTVFEGEINVES